MLDYAYMMERILEELGQKDNMMHCKRNSYMELGIKNTTMCIQN